MRKNGIVAAEPSSSPVAGYIVTIALPRYGQRCELRPTPDNFPVGLAFPRSAQTGHLSDTFATPFDFSLVPGDRAGPQATSTWCFLNVSIPKSGDALRQKPE